MSKQDGNFMQDCLCDVAAPDEISSYVESWHNDNCDNVNLHAFLGMTLYEYKIWLEHPKALNDIVMNRRVLTAILRKEKKVMRKMKRYMLAFLLLTPFVLLQLLVLFVFQTVLNMELCVAIAAIVDIFVLLRFSDTLAEIFYE